MRYLVWLFFFIPNLVTSDEYVLDLGSIGSVRYIYERGRLFSVERLTESGDLAYTHSYQYDNKGRLISEELIGGLGKVVYGTGTITTPYSEEAIVYLPQENLIRYILDGTEQTYAITNDGELMTEMGTINRDHNGRVLESNGKRFVYDEKDRLIEILSPSGTTQYTYNESGFRIARTTLGEIEHYLHLGINEYAILDDEGEVKEVRIPGLSPHQDILRPIAIEKGNTIYAPIHDILGNIIKLVDMHTGEVIALRSPGPFGESLAKDVPVSWIFSGKHFDSENNLVYFGYRYYSPELKEWLTADPVGQNLYQYCLGNPFAYMDPDGQFAFAIPWLQVAWGAGFTVASPLWAPAALTTAIIAGAAYASSKIYKNYQYIERNKKGAIDPGLPQDPFLDPNWEDISHPLGAKDGHFKFRNKQTGEIVDFDKGREGAFGHEGRDHFHRPNPDSTNGKKDARLDKDKKPVHKNSDEAHLYPE